MFCHETDTDWISKLSGDGLADFFRIELRKDVEDLPPSDQRMWGDLIEEALQTAKTKPWLNSRAAVYQYNLRERRHHG